MPSPPLPRRPDDSDAARSLSRTVRIERAALPEETLAALLRPPPSAAAPGPAGRGATARLLARRWPILLAVVPLTLADVAIDSGLTLSYKFLIDRAIVPHDARALVVILASLGAGVAVCSAVALYRDHVYARKVTALLAELRRAAFDRCQTLPIGAPVGQSSADLLSRLSTDIAGIESWLSGAVHGTVVPALSLVVGTGLLFYVLSWKLALASTLIWPLMLLGPRLVAPRAAAASYEKKEREAELLARVDETIAARRVIKAYGLEAFARSRFESALGRLGGVSDRTGFLGYLVERTTVVAICALQVAIVAAGSTMAYGGLVSVGSLVTAFSLYWNLGWWLVVLARSGPSLVAAAGSMRRLDELFDAPADPPDPPRAVSLGPLRRDIRFEKVGFAYPGRTPVLAGASFTVERGQFVAVVGPSGSGKSTVLNLLARFHEPTSGAILVDGVEAARVTVRSMRRQIAMVFQDTYLFDASVRENIRIGRPEASDDEVEAAAKAAEIHETIERLPEGYATVVGEGGSLLSGGQRQRLAIARALLRDAPLLLLDEATSALDPSTEASVNATLRRAARERTTVFVTHRLSAAVDADKILVVHSGAVAEQGTHAELLARDGVYADLWRKQNGFTLSDDGAVAFVSPERLRDIPLLHPLSDAQLASLAAQLSTARVAAGRPVIVEGEPASLFYLIARGRVFVTRQGPDGHPFELARLGDGDHFGELALLTDSPRTATVTARTDCVFLTLTRDQFEQLLATTPDVRATVERIALERRQGHEPPPAQPPSTPAAPPSGPLALSPDATP